MLYLCSSSSKEIVSDISTVFGGFATPYAPNPKLVRFGRLWAGDNGAFTRKFDELKFFTFLQKCLVYQQTNLFIACPDVVYNATETLKNYAKYSSKIRSMGYKVALVTQDGMTCNDDFVTDKKEEKIPFSDIDWLFIGGSNTHKNSADVVRLIKIAQSKGIKIHVGRVNGRKRLQYFKALGVDTVDGTHVNFEPKKAIQDIENWIQEN